VDIVHRVNITNVVVMTVSALRLVIPEDIPITIKAVTHPLFLHLSVGFCKDHEVTESFY
jgi:hypothetical protein